MKYVVACHITSTIPVDMVGRSEQDRPLRFESDEAGGVSGSQFSLSRLEPEQECRQQFRSTDQRIDVDVLIDCVRAASERSQSIEGRDTERTGEIRIAGTTDAPMGKGLADAGGD